jgi:hypothetical protein
VDGLQPSLVYHLAPQRRALLLDDESEDGMRATLGKFDPCAKCGHQHDMHYIPSEGDSDKENTLTCFMLGCGCRAIQKDQATWKT